MSRGQTEDGQYARQRFKWSGLRRNFIPNLSAYGGCRMLRIGFLFCFPLLFLLGCNTYHIKMVGNIDVKNTRVVKVPTKVRGPGAPEEDLTKLCGPDKLVYVRIFMNAPQVVWCAKDDKSGSIKSEQ